VQSRVYRSGAIPSQLIAVTPGPGVSCHQAGQQSVPQEPAPCNGLHPAATGSASNAVKPFTIVNQNG